MQLGIERLLENKPILQTLKKARVGLVAHPASVDHQLKHTVELLTKNGVKLSCLFGPQHGIRGEKQDNMIESEDFLDPILKIPAFSLYGKVRRPTPTMFDHFDILLFDLQDVGCRIYTFLTTLFYLIEDLNGTGKQIWVLDRPNPAGRPVEGNYLQKKYFSFVGGAELPMRHGLTLGEAALWFRTRYKFDTDVKVVEMIDYSLDGAEAQWGWPKDLAWVNPSPNLPTLTGCRTYPGTVLIEGTHLSEARGTTRPLEIVGAAMIEPEAWIHQIEKKFAAWTKGCLLRACYFEPTFHKFKGELCGGVQIHVDPHFYSEGEFRPYRLTAALLRTVHEMYPEFTIFKNPPYEYEERWLPIEILSGSSFLKTWVETSGSIEEFEQALSPDEDRWQDEREPFLLY
jgi:uncharacterized protein YbbC (DUF1343 family)